MKYKLTEQNKHTICPAAFNTVSVSMLDYVSPCTASEVIKGFTNYTDYWEGEPLRKLREDMVNGVRNDICKDCNRKLDTNAWNLRDYLQKQNPDMEYDLDSPVIENLFLRFSSACNYKCRNCIGSTSHLIRRENISLGLMPADANIIEIPGDSDSHLLDETKKVVSTVKNINFSGGDPLVHWQHWDMLQYLVDNNIKPELGYYTNLSILSRKKQSLIDLWNNFDKVSCVIGFDGIGAGGDYMRQGMSWDNTLANMDEVQAKAPHVQLQPVATLTWLNTINAVKMIKWFISNRKEYVGLNLVLHDLLDLQVAPREIKLKIEKSLLELKILMPKNEMVDGMINYMWAEDKSHLFENAVNWLDKSDSYRKVYFREAYPEFADVPVFNKPEDIDIVQVVKVMTNDIF